MDNTNNFLQWMTTNTQTKYWHDSANLSELAIGIKNGAIGVTTNPFLVGQTISNKADWAEKLDVIDKNLIGDEKVEAIMKVVLMEIAGRLPEQGNDKVVHGVCAQTNPSHPGKADFMLEQAERYAKWSPQITIKLPATRAGIKVAEICVSKGYNVAVTVSFTVPQVLAVGEALQRGFEEARENGIVPGTGIAVLMVGRLDDYLRDVMHDTTNDASEEDIIWAGTACVKRAYQIFNEKKYETYLMPAGCRGAYHITELAGANIICSISPSIYRMLGNVLETEFAEKINNPVNSIIIKRLQTMPEFIKAYEPDGMNIEEFISFGSTNRTLTQFVEVGWKKISSYEL
jgi:transaldolase